MPRLINDVGVTVLDAAAVFGNAAGSVNNSGCIDRHINEPHNIL